MSQAGESLRPVPPARKGIPWTNPTFWYVNALGFALGGTFNYLPLTFPVFESEFGATLEQKGRTQLIYFASALLIAAVGGWTIQKMGLKRAAIVSVLLLAVGLGAIGIAPSFAVVVAGTCLFGVAIAALGVVCNSLISETFYETRQSVFLIWGIVDAIGATLVPVFLGKWLAHAAVSGASWRWGYYATCLLLLFLGAWSFFIKEPQSFAHTQASSTRKSSHVMAEILAKPTIYFIGVAFLLHGLAQVGMVTWTGQLYNLRLRIDPAEAAYFISVNSAGFFVGRSILTWVTAKWKTPELLILFVSAAGGTLAFVATIAAPSYGAGLVCFAVAGMFISGDGPSLNSYTGFRFLGRSAIAFALIGAFGNIGAAIGPYLIGSLGSRLGLERAIWFMPVFSLGLAALALICYLKDPKAGLLLSHPSDAAL